MAVPPYPGKNTEALLNVQNFLRTRLDMYGEELMALPAPVERLEPLLLSKSVFVSDNDVVITQNGSQPVLCNLNERRLSKLGQRAVMITGMAMSPDKSVLYTAENLRELRAYDLSTNTSALLCTQQFVTASVWCAPNSKKLLFGVGNKSVLAFDPTDPGRVANTLCHTAEVYAATVSKDGTRIATCQENGLLRVFGMPGSWGDEKIELNGRSIECRVTRDLQYFYPTGGSNSSSSLRSIQLFSASDGKPFGHSVDPGGIVIDADVSHDSENIALVYTTMSMSDRRNSTTAEVSAHGGYLRVCDVATGTSSTDDIAFASEPRGVRFISDGASVVVCADGTCHKVDIGAGKIVESIKVYDTLETARNFLTNGCVNLSNDGKHLYVYGFTGHGMAAFDTEKLTRLFDVDAGPKVWCVRECVGKGVLALGTTDRGVMLVSSATGEEVAPALPHPSRVFSAQFSSDGELLLTGAQDLSARIWRWRAGEVMATLPHDDAVFDAIFLGDESLVATTSSDGYLRIWLGAAGKLVLAPVPLGAYGMSLARSKNMESLFAAGFHPYIFRIGTSYLANPEELGEYGRTRAELTASMRIDSLNNQTPILPDEWLRLWKEYKSAQATRLKFSPPDAKREPSVQQN